MATIKAVSSRASVGNAINYISKKEKTEQRLLSGISCSPATAIDEMKATKALWGKTEGRQYKHIVQSFPPGEKLTPEQAHKIALQLCADQFPSFEILIATHKDKEHIHSHIIVNSVSHEDGRKFQQSSADLQAIKDRSDELCRERGLSIAEKKNTVATYSMSKHKAIEKAETEGYKGFIVDCHNAMSGVRKRATSREDFILQMKAAGWETAWTDSRKHITFADVEGNKVRASNLEKTFKEPSGKEDLERDFMSNLERERKAAAPPQVSYQSEDDRQIDSRANFPRNADLEKPGVVITFLQLYMGTDVYKDFAARCRAEEIPISALTNKKPDAQGRTSFFVKHDVKDLERIKGVLERINAERRVAPTRAPQPMKDNTPMAERLAQAKIEADRRNAERVAPKPLDLATLRSDIIEVFEKIRQSDAQNAALNRFKSHLREIAPGNSEVARGALNAFCDDMALKLFGHSPIDAAKTAHMVQRAIEESVPAQGRTRQRSREYDHER